MTVKVVCVVPRGLHGQGGIERLFLYASRTDVFERHGVAMTYVTSRGPGSFANWAALFPLRLARIAVAILTSGCAIVHINLSVNSSAHRKVFVFYLARLLGKKTVIHFHGGGFDSVIFGRALSTRIILHLFREADRAVVLGERLRDLFSRASGRPATEIDVVLNGVPDFRGETDAQRTDDGTLRIMFAGELGQRKGTDIVLRALGILDRSFKDWRCRMAGNGDSRPFKAMADAADISSKVEFLGWVGPDAIHDGMIGADIVVLPSRGEALPIALIEGACAGAALVSSDAGASREVAQDGRNGVVVPVEPEAVAAAFERLGRDRALLRRMQEASRQVYEERFTVDIMVRDLATIYRDLNLESTRD